MDAGMLDGAHAEEQITDLLRPYGGYRLTADQLSACPGGPAFGWEIPVNVRHRGRPVRLRLVAELAMNDGFRPLKQPVRDAGFADGPGVWAWDPTVERYRPT